MSFWCCIRSLPRREVYASERIQAAGYDTFLPMLQTKRAAQPLFPGYLFAFVIEQWRALNTTIGVLCVVRTGDCPCKMPDAEIDSLKAMVVGGFVRLPEAPAAPAKRVIAIGSRVKITSGPFGGWHGLYDGMSTRDREKILLNLLGGQRQVLVHHSLVVPAQ